MSFMDNLKKETTNEISITENGAIGYRTTGKELLDINFKITSMRMWSEEQIKKNFERAYFENPLLAIKWLFYARDVRGGAGERRLFRVCFDWLLKNKLEIAKKLLFLIPEYGRWDDLTRLVCEDAVANDIMKIVSTQLAADLVNAKENKSISLLAKWMPSEHASSNDVRKRAKDFIKCFGCTEREYRKILSSLRAYLKVVERDMSAKRWTDIDYSIVPSKANLKYNKAFLKNDEARRREYLESLKNGETKINASTLSPHEIVSDYMTYDGWNRCVKNLDDTLEALWKALPDYVKGEGSTICVADGSGSMETRIGRTKARALDVANALAIYFSEKCSGEFKNKYITFSRRPQFVDFSNATTLRDKIKIASNYNEVADTNIEAVFELILKTAINNHMKQEEIPANILILSDMEFNYCAIGNNGLVNKALFEMIKQRYEAHGYKLPRLVFWNICGRTGTIPVKENDMGVALVSGFSPAIMKMVMSNKTDPFEVLVEQLNSERYEAVEQAVKGLI